MSNSLIKLLDYSLLPAAIMLLGKVVGVFITALLFNIQVGLQSYPQLLFSAIPVVDYSQLQQLSTYSDLFMYVLVASGFTIVLVGALFMHDSHIEVQTINLLAKYDLLFLIRSSFELYHSGVIWFAFTWLANIVILINVLAGKTLVMILIITVGFTIGLSILLFRDLFAELELTRKKLLEGSVNG